MPPKTPSREAPAPERAPAIMSRLADEHPRATVALRASNPLEMLVATILSAQCTDARVNEVTETLFVKYRAPQDYLAVPEAELAEDVRPTGFFNQKTRSIRAACQRIVDVYGGEVPDTMEDLTSLQGVARKTANIVLTNSFGKVEGIPIDTHMRRLSQRLGFTTNTDPDKIERDLMALWPKECWVPWTYALIEHGRAVCKAQRPRCGDCVVEGLCPSSQA